MDGQNMSPNILAYAEEQIVGLVISNQKTFWQIDSFFDSEFMTLLVHSYGPRVNFTILVYENMTIK